MRKAEALPAEAPEQAAADPKSPPNRPLYAVAVARAVRKKGEGHP